AREMGVVGGATLRSLAVGPITPRLPSPRVGDGSRGRGDSPLSREWSDRPSTPVSMRGRRGSLRGRLFPPSRRARPPLDSRLRAGETGVVARATLHSVTVGPTAPRLPSPFGRLSAPSRRARPCLDARLRPGDSSLPRGEPDHP